MGLGPYKYECLKPTQVKFYKNKYNEETQPIKHVSIGEKHAGAIDIYGKAYLWGSGS